MVQRQKGQAFILVLILLAVGGLLITPALNLASTGLQSRMTQHTNLMEYYATDGAQEYSLWRLTHEAGFATSLSQNPGNPSEQFYIILNRVQADYTITAQVPDEADAPSGSPYEFPGFDPGRYRITVDVDPDGSLVPLAPGVPRPFTYTITLQYMYPDVETEPLEQLRVTFPPGFTYDGPTIGFITVDPDKRTGGLSQGYTYEWNFDPAISFNYYEEKPMSFQATGAPEETCYTEVEARVPQVSGSTGPTAFIFIEGSPDPGIAKLMVTKTVSPEVIPLGELTRLTYTITLTNLSSEVVIEVQKIEDALPAGFVYVAFSSSGILYLPPPKGEPVGTPGTRLLLEWKYTPAPILYIPLGGEPVSGTFQAEGTVDSSGTYANEVYVTAPGATQEYTWPTSGVIVPQFDIESGSGGTTLKAVAQLSGSGHKIRSWQVE